MKERLQSLMLGAALIFAGGLPVLAAPIAPGHQAGITASGSRASDLGAGLTRPADTNSMSARNTNQQPTLPPARKAVKTAADSDINYDDLFFSIARFNGGYESYEISYYDMVYSDNTGYNIPIQKGDSFHIQSRDGKVLFSTHETVEITPENNVCEYELWTMDAGWNGFYAVSDIEGLYRISVEFEGTKAKVSFGQVCQPDENRELYLRGSFNGWGSPEDWKFTRDAATGLYHLNDKAFEGSVEFKIATDDWRAQYSSNYHYPDNTLQPNVPCELTFGIDLDPNLSANLNGTYDITLDPSVPSVLFEEKRGDTPAINYGEFAFVCGGISKVAWSMAPTEVLNQYVARNIPLGPDSYFYLYDWTNAFVLFGGNSFVTPDQTAELYYWTPESGEPYVYFMGCDGFDGLYDVTIDFDGTIAKLQFEKTGDLVFNPETVQLHEQSYGGMSLPAEVEGHTAIYKNITLHDYNGYGFVFGDYRTGRTFGAATDEVVITPDNLRAEIIGEGVVYYVMVNDLDGEYDIALKYNEDFTAATMTLSKSDLSQEEFYAQYSGDLYLYGNCTRWEHGVPEYKMTCVEPGIFEWSGEELIYGFGFSAGTENSVDLSTGYSLDFRSPYDSDQEPVIVGMPYPVVAGYGYSFGFENYGIVSNPKLVLNLRDMTLLVTQEEDPATYLNVVLENGASFSMSANPGEEREVSISTNDPYWGIFGYNLYGYGWDVYLDGGPVPVLNLTLVLEGPTELLCYLKYTGECKVLNGTVGVVEFDNEVTITRVPDGVEIRNVGVGEQVAVYTLSGQLITLATAQSDSLTVNLQKGETYIVRVGSVAAKVLM